MVPVTDLSQNQPPLMTIGAFSRATLVSVRSLRAYHERGILVPAVVAPNTGYRAYHPGQIPDAVALRRLRELDVPLPVVGQILEARDPEVTAKLLADHEAEMRARLAETERIVAELQRAAAEPGQGLPVHLRTIDHQHALALTDSVAAKDFGPFLDRAYAALWSAVGVGGFVPAGPPAALYCPEANDPDAEPVTAYVPVTEPGPIPPAAGVELIEVPAATVAAAIHEGDYLSIGDAYASLGAWVAYHAHPTDDPVREVYVVSYGETDDPARFRTEIHWPVRARAESERQP